MKAILKEEGAAPDALIAQSAETTISSGQQFVWSTANGASCVIAVYNLSRTNNCVIAITGAPASGIIVMVNGVMQTKPLDGIYTIAPNNPGDGITAMGNFGGSNVTVTNITNPQNNATAHIITQVPSAGAAFEAFLMLAGLSPGQAG